MFEREILQLQDEIGRMQDQKQGTVLKEKCERLRRENDDLKLMLAEVGFFQPDESEEYGPEDEERWK